MIEIKKFVGHFTNNVYSNYTYNDLDIYKLFFACIFPKSTTNMATIFIEKIEL